MLSVALCKKLWVLPGSLPWPARQSTPFCHKTHTLILLRTFPNRSAEVVQLGLVKTMKRSCRKSKHLYYFVQNDYEHHHLLLFYIFNYKTNHHLTTSIIIYYFFRFFIPNQSLPYFDKIYIICKMTSHLIIHLLNIR